MVSFSPDGARVAVAGASPKLWICELSTRECAELKGHLAVVHDLVFLDDRTLATASGDGTVQIWDLETKERRVLEGHLAPVFGLAASPDGRTVASASGDAAVRLWTVVRPPKNADLRAFLDGLSREHFARGIADDQTD
jgi:WD40 repeat protein